MSGFRRGVPVHAAGALLLLLAGAGCGGADDGSTAAAAPDGPAAAGAAAKPTGAVNPPSPAPAARPATRFTGPDVSGIHLSMTPEQAEAVLRAADPAPQRIQTMQATYRYNVLSKRMETDPFITAVVAEFTAPNARSVLEAGIAPPPQGGTVVAVRRYHRQDLQRLPRAEYRAALAEKYGEPDEETETVEGGTPVLTLTWRLGGGPVQCIHNPFGATIGSSLMERLLDAQGNPRNPQATSLSDCANVLLYQLRDDPVYIAQGVMWDVAREVATQESAQAWIAELQQQAAQPGTGRPSL